MGYPTYGNDLAEQRIAELEAERDELDKQLTAMQQILALLLQQHGEPVVLTDEEVQNGLPEGTQIYIEEDVVKKQHVLGLTSGQVDNPF